MRKQPSGVVVAGLGAVSSVGHGCEALLGSHRIRTGWAGDRRPLSYRRFPVSSRRPGPGWPCGRPRWLAASFLRNGGPVSGIRRNLPAQSPRRRVGGTCRAGFAFQERRECAVYRLCLGSGSRSLAPGTGGRGGSSHRTDSALSGHQSPGPTASGARRPGGPLACGNRGRPPGHPGTSYHVLNSLFVVHPCSRCCVSAPRGWRGGHGVGRGGRCGHAREFRRLPCVWRSESGQVCTLQRAAGDNPRRGGWVHGARIADPGAAPGCAAPGRADRLRPLQRRLSCHST